MSPVFTDSVVEDAARAWLAAIGWRVLHGAEIATGMPAAERADYGEVVLGQRPSASTRSCRLPW
jgi:type I restriction enzyme R subunit